MHRPTVAGRLLAVVLLSLAAAAAKAATWTNVDLAPYADWRMQSQGGMSGVPAGVSNFAGVPFLSDASGNNSWNGDLAPGANPRVLDIPVSVRSVRSVRILINTIWGQTTGTYCTLAVTDSAGDVDSLQLVGGQHVRDYNQGSFAATINGTTTVEGWNDGTCGSGRKRLDVLTLTLPAVFQGKRVTRIRVIDNGASNVQRACVSGLTLETADALTHLPVDLSAACNWTWKDVTGMDAEPAGSVDVAGEPFVTPGSGNDCWNANLAGANPVTLTLPVKRDGVKTVHTLINTLFGQPGPSSYATVSFFYQGGARVDVPLTGGVDVRDYNVYTWTNTVNGTTTTNVWNNGECATSVGHRLDMQTITLPTAYLATRLDSIRFTDTGADNFQRLVVHAVTLDADSSLVNVSVDAPPTAAPPLGVSPNPSGGAFRVALGEMTAGRPATVEVFDVRGRRVGVPLVAATGVRVLDLGREGLGVPLAPGLYFVHVRSGGVCAVTRVVVMR